MEFVYVVPREHLFAMATPHGFVGGQPPPGHPSLAEYLDRLASHGYFAERRWAEGCARVKQIIPYTLVTHGDAIFLSQRLGRSGEARLRGKRSVGIGGHLDPVDAGSERAELLFRGAHRELQEELVLDVPGDVTPVGVINDETTEVGSVHFGIVLRIELATSSATVREADVLSGAFRPVAEVRALATDPEQNFETWSSLILADWDRLGHRTG
jgi:predicted NUDIX family phosphoesterase